MTDRCAVVPLDLRDLTRSAGDPALAALLRDGWTVAATIALDDDATGPRLHLILAPPRALPAPAPVPPPAPSDLRVAYALGGLVVGLVVAFAVAAYGAA